MAHAAEDLEAYLDTQEHKSLLRFMTCGSVDDGKSTLIGRLLYESNLVFEDHLAALLADSKKHGTQGDELDLALLVDGLTAQSTPTKSTASPLAHEPEEMRSALMD